MSDQDSVVRVLKSDAFVVADGGGIRRRVWKGLRESFRPSI